MRSGSLRGQSSVSPSGTHHGTWRLGAATAMAALVLAGCGGSKAAAPPTSTIPATTTTTAPPVVSKLTVVGVRPGVNQPPFYPQITVTQVTCGVSPRGGRFVRVDLPAGGSGTPSRTALTNPTAVIVATGGAVLLDPRYLTRVLYAESMKSVTTAKQGAFVLTMHNVASTSGDKLSVVSGNVQLYGDYECPDADVAYPG